MVGKTGPNIIQKYSIKYWTNEKIYLMVKCIFGDWLVSQGRCYNKVKSWTLLGHWNLNYDYIVLKHVKTCRTYLLVTE